MILSTEDYKVQACPISSNSCGPPRAHQAMHLACRDSGASKAPMRHTNDGNTQTGIDITTDDRATRTTSKKVVCFQVYIPPDIHLLKERKLVHCHGCNFYNVGTPTLSETYRSRYGRKTHNSFFYTFYLGSYYMLRETFVFAPTGE